MKETGNTVLSNANRPEKPTPGVEWATLPKVGIGTFVVPAKYGEVGKHIVYKTKEGKLMDCTIISVIAENESNGIVYVAAQFPPKEAKKPRQTAEERTLDLIRKMKAEGLI